MYILNLKVKNMMLDDVEIACIQELGPAYSNIIDDPEPVLATPNSLKIFTI